VPGSSVARRWAPWLLLVAVVVVALVIATSGSGSSSPTSREARIEAEVRCPQCEGQSALESDAPAARAVRSFVATQVSAGQTDGQIEQALEDKYGSDILLRPPASGIDGLVWVIPVIAFAFAIGLLYLSFRKWRLARVGAFVSDEDRALVAEALKRQ
jgi:cytochrome c-type biogenesis protein CcmH